MHLSLLLSIASATASTYAAAVGYTSTIQSLDKSLADAGLQSYAKDANLTKGWTQATRCEVAVSHPRHRTVSFEWEAEHL